MINLFKRPTPEDIKKNDAFMQTRKAQKTIHIAPIRFYQIDFLKFFFALVICYCHGILLLSPTFSQETITFFFATRQNTVLAVDFFFIISGFFLFYKNNSSIKEFIQKKLLRLLPAFYLSILGCFLFQCLNIPSIFIDFSHINFIYLFLNISLLGFITNTQFLFLTWFICALFWISLIYFFMHKKLQKKHFLILTLIAVLISYLFLAFYSTGTWDTLKGILKIGHIRAFLGLGIGILISEFYKKKKHLNPISEGNKCPKDTLLKVILFSKKFSFLTISCLEITLFYLLIQGIFFTHTLMALQLITIFTVLFFLLLQNKGLLSWVLNHRYWIWFGGISYMIYLSHIFSFPLTQSIMLLCGLKFNTPIMYMGALIFGAILFATILHVIIERPLISFLNNKILGKKS